METPVEIDTAIAEQLQAIRKAEYAVVMQERYRDGKYGSLMYDEAVYAKALQTLDQEQAKLDSLNDLYTGWTRYWHVTNTNGHIHTSHGCTSCFPDTQYSWRTDLSGLTPAEVVEREAHNACSVCMPIAPVEQRAARERYNAEQRQARKDDRQAKADEKLRKAAIRAQKLLAKVEAWYEDFGGFERAMNLPHGHETGLYSAVYAFGIYSDRKEAQSSVASAILEDEREYRGERRYDKNPREIIAQAQAKGLI